MFFFAFLGSLFSSLGSVPRGNVSPGSGEVAASAAAGLHGAGRLRQQLLGPARARPWRFSAGRNP